MVIYVLINVLMVNKIKIVFKLFDIFFVMVFCRWLYVYLSCIFSVIIINYEINKVSWIGKLKIVVNEIIIVKNKVSIIIIFYIDGKWVVFKLVFFKLVCRFWNVVLFKSKMFLFFNCFFYCFNVCIFMSV